jgi:uncharacterized protein YbbK (DUF523 family)
MSKIMVSACLLGRNCKYNGGNNLDEKVIEFVRGHEVIEVCPEEAAGLGIPRVPMEIVDGVLINKEGIVVDEPVRRTVASIVEQHRDADLAILKSRSPTCGVKQVYDGTFSGLLRDGAGILAQALMDAGLRVIDSEDI